VLKMLRSAVAPYVTKALAIAAALSVVGCAILWLRGQALAERYGKLEAAIADNERTIAALRAQHIAANAVAEMGPVRSGREVGGAQKNGRLGLG
jgi:hypothetical protein